MFALAKANGRFDPANPKPVPKDNFIVLLQHAKLAGLETDYDVDKDLLTAKDGCVKMP